MAERALILTGPEVRAVLAGQKTQHRVPMKPKTRPWENHHLEGGCCQSDWSPNLFEDGQWWWSSSYAAPEPIGRCPLGTPGDTLWVRETWYTPPFLFSDTCRGYAADGPPPQDQWGYRVRPSSNMPRHASRITLEVVRVWAQRAQDVTEEEAIAEGSGAALMDLDGRAYDRAEDAWCRYTKRIDPNARVASSRGAFAARWNARHPKTPWRSNPWVWACEWRVRP